MTGFFAIGSYWYNFKHFWLDFFGNQSGVVLIALGAGAIGIIIICSGKSRK